MTSALSALFRKVPRMGQSLVRPVNVAGRFASVRPVCTTRQVLQPLIPTVVEYTPRGERYHDIFSRLLKERIICVMGPISEELSAVVVAQLLYCESEAPESPISMYINSPGGFVTAGMAIYDTMQYIKSPVHTLCMGQAASMGSLLLAAGEPGHRFILPNARVMVHQPSGGASGQASDIAIHAKEILETRERLNKIYQQHTGQDYDIIEKALERDNFMSPERAKEFGLVDEVIAERTEETKADGNQKSD
eukprot:Clim_evm43s201 gene=Clim_evmTU43s201